MQVSDDSQAGSSQRLEPTEMFPNYTWKHDALQSAVWFAVQLRTSGQAGVIASVRPSQVKNLWLNIGINNTII